MSAYQPFRDLRADPFGTLARWQDGRFLWALMVVVSLSMVVLAHAVFQHWLYMRPCEQCVYIRFAFFVMAFGGLLALINPRNVVLKLAGYALGFWGIALGIGYSVKLNRIHHAAHSDNPFGVQGCSTEPVFPLGLPLDRWAPDWFKPTGDCGFDNPIVPDGVELSGLQAWLVDFYKDGWYLVPSAQFMNMAQATLLAYVAILACLGLAFVAWVVTTRRSRSPTHPATPAPRGTPSLH